MSWTAGLNGQMQGHSPLKPFRESCAKSAFDRGPTLDRAFCRESRIIIVEKNTDAKEYIERILAEQIKF